MLSLETLYTWLQACPVFAGSPLSPDYLPSYDGYSLSLGKTIARKDILGNSRAVLELRISRRLTIPDTEARLAVHHDLSTVAAWAEANPPGNARVLSRGVPRFSARGASGVEDHTVTITIEER